MANWEAGKDGRVGGWGAGKAGAHHGAAGPGGNVAALLRGRELTLAGKWGTVAVAPGQVLGRAPVPATGKDRARLWVAPAAFWKCPRLPERETSYLTSAPTLIFDVRGETFVLMTRAFDRAGAAQTICTIARPSDANFAEQRDWLRAWAVLRPERVPEILDQMDVPMGLWASVMDLNSTTTPYSGAD